MSSTPRLDTNFATPGEDDLNELFDTVIQGFSMTPVSPDGSVYSNDVYADSEIERHGSLNGSVHSLQRSSSCEYLDCGSALKLKVL